MGLGLVPVVLIGLPEGKEANDNARRVLDWLQEDQVPARIIETVPDLSAHTIADVRAAIGAQQIPIVSIQAARGDSTDARFGLLTRLSTALETRKVVFLSTSSGLERRGSPRIDVVNLNTDYDHLLTSSDLARRHQIVLRRTKALLDAVPHRMTVTVVNPLHLLRELFTVSGAGTLVRKGSRIETHRQLATLDQPKLEALIESAFGRKLRATGLAQPWERIYVEENYRGAAMLVNSPVGVYLSKFAVERQAQGEGIGGDIWNVMLRDYSRFFWRGRPDNPIDPWYNRKCDAMVRMQDWHVYSYGVDFPDLPGIIEYATTQPLDLEH